VIPNQGLLRLELQVRFNRLRKTKRIYFFFQRNDFLPTECEAYEKIQYLLKNRRDPIFKSKETQDETASGGRDTVGTPHARSRTGLSLFSTHLNTSIHSIKTKILKENKNGIITNE
jgi:hypothetical protein